MTGANEFAEFIIFVGLLIVLFASLGVHARRVGAV